jgi:predicted PurR-regulated permease PerM/methanogenic corrinoid protein MtbC1
MKAETDKQFPDADKQLLPDKQPLPIEEEDDDQFALVWAFAPVVAFLIVTAALYAGREILLPLAMAVILAVIFSPVATRLERFVGPLLSSAIVVLLVVGLMTAMVYFLTVELTTVADNVSQYSDNIGNKLAALEKTTPPWLQHIQQAVADVEQRVERANPSTKKPSKAVVQAVSVPPSLGDHLKPVFPVLAGLVNFLLVVTLLFFLLYSRRDLRDRIVRLAARARITLAAQAIETAGEVVGRYLLLFSLTNLAYGIATATVVWFLGMPNPELWGLLAFLFRYIPYVGAMTSAVLPSLVAFAIFPGWAKSLEILAAFVILDQVAAQFVEPFVIGRGIGVSPVALLISAMYWSWLWGIPGLLLATPMTACLKVAADYIPALGFLAILLGADRDLDDYHDFYRMLLELDPAAARALATSYCDEHGLEATFDDVFVPALLLMGKERAEDHISQENQQLIIDTISVLIADLGKRFNRPRVTPSVRVLGAVAPNESHDLGLLMVLELLRHDGVAASFAGSNKSVAELCDLVKRFTPEFVFLSCTIPENLPAALEFVRWVKKNAPRVTILVGGAAALSEPQELLDAGAVEVCPGRNTALRAIRRYILQRARSRFPGARLLPGFALEPGESAEADSPSSASPRA